MAEPYSLSQFRADAVPAVSINDFTEAGTRRGAADPLDMAGPPPGRLLRHRLSRDDPGGGVDLRPA